MPRQASSALQHHSGSSAGHLVHDALLLVPVGTTSHGTAKQYSIGTVHSVLPSMLAQGSTIVNGAEVRATAQTHASPLPLKWRGLRPAKAVFCQIHGAVWTA